MSVKPGGRDNHSVQFFIKGLRSVSHASVVTIIRPDGSRDYEPATYYTGKKNGRGQTWADKEQFDDFMKGGDADLRGMEGGKVLPHRLP